MSTPEVLIAVGLVFNLAMSLVVIVTIRRMTDLGRGPKGDPGERGPQGERGDKGDRGDQGKQADSPSARFLSVEKIQRHIVKDDRARHSSDFTTPYP